MADVNKVLKKLKNNKSYSKQVASIIEVPPREAIYKQLSPSFPPQIEAFKEQNKLNLYSHQVEVVERVRKGENVVLVTSTASGKTLAFTLPVFEGLIKEQEATALYLYPMKALAYDQLKEFKEMEKKMGLKLGAAVYDGDTPKSSRSKIRRQSRLIISNPHAFHLYLNWHHLWRHFFRNLKYIVIDEAHWYKGVYGTNTAFLLRRLRRILNYYGAKTQFIMASATMADPLEHAEKLTGEEFVLVSSDGSAKGKKTYLFWETAQNPARSQHLQTADLMRACIDQGLQSLCFAVSRKMAELTSRWTSKAGDVAPYRAGYLPEERRRLEKEFKEGRLKGIVSTNALELGVNIGGLDAVIIGGYPGTISSFHQRSGRAGRSKQEALVVQLLYDNPLDSYILAHPNFLFKEPVEQAVISLENEYILKSHLACAGEELPLKKEDEKFFGNKYISSIKELAQENLLVRNSGPGSQEKQYIYRGKGACFKVSLSAFDNEEYHMVLGDKVLEKLSKRQAYTEAHPGAVFLHMGEQYRVSRFDSINKRVEVGPLEEDLYTSHLSDIDIAVKKVFKSKKIGKIVLNYGQVAVSEQVLGYVLKRFDAVIGRKDLDLPPLPLNTMAVWVELPLAGVKGDHEGGLHGAEHLLIAVTPLLAMCDRWDIGGVSIPEKGKGKIFIYDGFPGGIGISERLFNHYDELVDKGLEIARKCSCEEGCPRCIISPKCGNNNEPLSKNVAAAILKILKEELAYPEEPVLVPLEDEIKSSGTEISLQKDKNEKGAISEGRDLEKEKRQSEAERQMQLYPKGPWRDLMSKRWGICKGCGTLVSEEDWTIFDGVTNMCLCYDCDPDYKKTI